MSLRSAAARVLCAFGLLALTGCQTAALPQQNLPGAGLSAKPAAVESQNKGNPAVNPTPEPLAATEAEAEQLPASTAVPADDSQRDVDLPEVVEQEEPATEAAQTPTTAAVNLSAERWKEWPVIPVVPEAMREVYQRGLAEGRRAGAFSILGDCQSQPDVFLGIFDSDPDFVTTLPENLQATARQFRGSFDRYSPTVKDGTTEGALLWYDWNDNKEKKCTYGETPLECELRVHQPSIVFVHVGTHYENRQMRYMRRIIERILEFGAVPVIVTKADNRELDEKVNLSLVTLAVEYELPVWNFWRSVQDLPNRGMEDGSNMYLNEAGLDVHRTGGIEALDAVWRGLK